MGKLKKILGFTALALAMFMGTLDSTIINIALPDIMTYFKASLNDVNWISAIITPIVVPMAIQVFGVKNTQKVAGAIGGVPIKYINWQAIFLSMYRLP